LDNDANAGALGEWCYGAGQGCATLFYITISTGVGGGWIINREVYHGANGLAGEIGHVLIDPNGPLCGCGRRGCLEALACGPAIARAARERLSVDTQAGATLRHLVADDLGALTAEHVGRAASAGDVLAQTVLLEAAWALGIGIGHVLSLMNPDRVVLGGGVTKAGERYLDAVQQAARTNTLPNVTTEIVLTALGDDAPLWGAFALARQAVTA
jgi:glucokinase